MAPAKDVGLPESDSVDGTFDLLEERLPELRRRFRRVTLRKRSFGYRLPAGQPRWAPHLQLERRSVPARSRNLEILRADA